MAAEETDATFATIGSTLIKDKEITRTTTPFSISVEILHAGLAVITSFQFKQTVVIVEIRMQTEMMGKRKNMIE